MIMCIIICEECQKKMELVYAKPIFQNFAYRFYEEKVPIEITDTYKCCESEVNFLESEKFIITFETDDNIYMKPEHYIFRIDGDIYVFCCLKEMVLWN